MFVSFLNSNAQNPVQEFNFNGNLNSADNSISFLGTPVFVNDRNGIAKGALRLTNKALQAVVGELPQANKPKTISVWVKFNTVNTANYIFNYGAPVNGQYFALIQQPATSGLSDLSLVGWGDANNLVVSVPLVKETWYMYSVTYEGNVSKIYRNGELLKAVEGIQRSAKGYILSLGKLNTATSINADIDDLKLYSVAMTDEQVLEAYNSSKPTIVAPQTTQVANTPKKAVAPSAKAQLAPPVVASSAETKAKNIEVYSEGKRILETNTINIGDLPDGTYLIKISNSAAKK